MARPIKLVEGGASGGVLTLMAEPAASLFLQHEARALCARINVYLGRVAIQRLKFVPGSIHETAKSRPKRPQAGAAPLPGDPARTFKGPESLKDSLLALASARQSPDHANRD
jgi:hypothetical protein